MRLFSVYVFAFIILLLSCVACNSLKENFEDIEGKVSPVVECYLEPNQPIKLTLSNSEGFFAPFDTSRAYWQQIVMINDAQVIISGAGFSDTLLPMLAYDFLSNRVFNYTSTRFVPATLGVTYDLSIKLANGKTIKSKCTALPSVPIDSMSYSYNPDFPKYARAITHFTDPTPEINYYQYVLRYDRNYDTIPRQNIPFPDDFFESNKITFYGTYDLVKNQKAIGTLINISKEYHDFLRSLNLAILGSQTPVVQPSPIISNVWGTAEPIGIFTYFSVARDTVLIE